MSLAAVWCLSHVPRAGFTGAMPGSALSMCFPPHWGHHQCGKTLPHELSTLPHGQALKRGIGKPIEPYPSIKELCSILGRNLSSEELSNHPIWENRGIKSTSVCCEPGLCCSCFGYFGTKQILVGVVLFDHCLVLSHLVSPFTGELEPKSGSREAAQESGF